MRHSGAGSDKQGFSVWVWIVLVLVLVGLVLALAVKPAEAADDWDQLVPDEYGVAVFVLPAVEDSDRGLATLSWGFVQVGEWEGFATVLRPYWRQGFGLDAGKATRKVRFGAGWLNRDTCGLYLRRAF